MVRSVELAPEALLDAMHRGDFYASTGVVLDDVQYDGARYTVTVDPSMAGDCTVQFIGTRQVDGEIGPIGEVLLATTSNPAVYEVTGDELYVRARVISTRPPRHPYRPGDVQQAWTQPVARKRKSPGAVADPGDADVPESGSAGLLWLLPVLRAALVRGLGRRLGRRAPSFRDSAGLASVACANVRGLGGRLLG